MRVALPDDSVSHDRKQQSGTARLSSQGCIRAGRVAQLRLQPRGRDGLYRSCAVSAVASAAAQFSEPPIGFGVCATVARSRGGHVCWGRVRRRNGEPRPADTDYQESGPFWKREGRDVRGLSGHVNHQVTISGLSVDVTCAGYQVNLKRERSIR